MKQRVLFENKKALLILVIVIAFLYVVFGGITFDYARVTVLPSMKTHLDANFYHNDNIELFDKSLIIGWKTKKQRGKGIDAGVFVGYKYQRCGGRLACLEFNCFGWQSKKEFEYTDKLGQVENIASRRCLGIISYKNEWVE